MSVNAATIGRIAHLARLALREEETEPLATELSSIFDWIEALDAVDIEGIDPMVTPVEGLAPLRDDVVSDGHKREAVLANAPRAEEGYFVMPKVME